MDPAVFERTFKDIVKLNLSEGPPRNVLEPKFEARKQMEALNTSLLKAWESDEQSRDRSSVQLIRTIIFLGNNFFECEEDKDGLKLLLTAHAAAIMFAEGKTFDFLAPVPTPIEAVLSSTSLPCTDATSFRGIELVVEVLNSLGILLSARANTERIGDARKVLQDSEKCFGEWRAHASERGYSSLEDLQITPEGALPDDASEEARFTLRLNQLHTNTLFYLGQAYGAMRDVKESSKYIHHTMIAQWLCKADFNPKDWATNAVHLSGFYAGEEDFGAALHCLAAARYVMPDEEPKEETVGVVHWGFGKVLKAWLERCTKETVTPEENKLCTAGWWRDFPLPIDPPTQPSIITDFSGARDVFKQARRELEGAAVSYPFDGCCPDHIAIQQDVSELYRILTHFEPCVDRRIAMHHRRLDLIRAFPDKLHFNAYATLVRQLRFDIGDIESDIVDLRIQQRQQGLKPCMGDSRINELSADAFSTFNQFVESFGEKAKEVDADNVVAVFRALMRMARQQGRKLFNTPKEEYDNIGLTCDAYRAAVEFAKRHPKQIAEVREEQRMAEEMVRMLPEKQREVWCGQQAK